MAEHAPDPHRQARAREHARTTRRLLLLELALGVGFLLVMLLSGLSSGLSESLGLPHTARVAVYTIILAACYVAISAPLTFYGGFVVPHRYGLSHQNLRSWFVDQAKEALLAAVLGLGIIVVLYELIRVSTDLWWAWTSVFLVFLTVILTWLAPVLILPLFFETRPLSESDLRERLLVLARRCDAGISGVFEIGLGEKTPAGNAMLLGWGGTRRIAISDTVLSRYAPEEIEVIMAHELGHHRHRHVMQLIVVQSALILLAFYVAHLVLSWAAPGLGLGGVWDVAGLPLIVLTVGGLALALMPLVNAFSRRLERDADEYSLQATDNPGAFTSMLTRLTDQNLVESRPSRWVELLLYDHPSLHSRLETARRYRAIEEPK